MYNKKTPGGLDDIDSLAAGADEELANVSLAQQTPINAKLK